MECWGVWGSIKQLESFNHSTVIPSNISPAKGPDPRHLSVRAGLTSTSKPPSVCHRRKSNKKNAGWSCVITLPRLVHDHHLPSNCLWNHVELAESWPLLKQTQLPAMISQSFAFSWQPVSTFHAGYLLSSPVSQPSQIPTCPILDVGGQDLVGHKSMSRVQQRRLVTHASHAHGMSRSSPRCIHLSSPSVACLWGTSFQSSCHVHFAGCSAPETANAVQCLELHQSWICKNGNKRILVWFCCINTGPAAPRNNLQ